MIGLHSLAGTRFNARGATSSLRIILRTVADRVCAPAARSQAFQVLTEWTDFPQLEELNPPTVSGPPATQIQ